MSQIFGSAIAKTLKWVVGSDQPNEKLFDEAREDINEKYKILDGKVEDQTTVLSQTNLSMHDGPFFGKKKELYIFMDTILEDNGLQIFKVNGNKGIGKTRFIKTVANRLY